MIRSSVREFLCSEAMHFLGVPTSRAARWENSIFSKVSTRSQIIHNFICICINVCTSGAQHYLALQLINQDWLPTLRLHLGRCFICVCKRAEMFWKTFESMNQVHDVFLLLSFWSDHALLCFSLIVSDEPVLRDQFYSGNVKTERGRVIHAKTTSKSRFHSLSVTFNVSLRYMF